MPKVRSRGQKGAQKGAQAGPREAARVEQYVRCAPRVLVAEDVSRLNLVTMDHPKTIHRWADGERVKRTTAVRLGEAAGKLGIERIAKAPEEPKSTPRPRREEPAPSSA